MPTGRQTLQGHEALGHLLNSVFSPLGNCTYANKILHAAMKGFQDLPLLTQTQFENSDFKVCALALHASPSASALKAFLSFDTGSSQSQFTSVTHMM